MFKLKYTMKLSLTITMCLSKTFLIVEDQTIQNDTFLEYYTDSLSIFYSNDANFNDSLNTILSNDLVFWENRDSLTSYEKLFMQNFKLLGGSLSLFKKNISDDDFFINNFGGTFLRNISSNWLILDSDTLELQTGSQVAELQIVDINSEIVSIYNDFEISSIQSSNYLLNGFFIDDIVGDDLLNFISKINNNLSQDHVEIKIGHIQSEGYTDIIIPIEIINNRNIKSIDMLINFENDYLSDYVLIPTERSIGFDWQIFDLPFGNIRISGESSSDYIIEGDGPVAFINAVPNLESVGKIVIDIIESAATDNFENDLNTINSNGEINFLFDVPLLYFDNNNSVELGNSSILSLNLKNDMFISGFQLCMEFDSENILFVQASKPNRIPDDWWVGQYGIGSNDQVQFASIGFSSLAPGDGPILDIEYLSVGETPQIASIGICDSYLLDDNSVSLETQFYNSTINIYIPEIFITPKIIKSHNYLDLILSYDSNTSFIGYQIDIQNTNGPILGIYSYYDSYISNNYVDETLNRIVSFSNNSSIFPETGYLFIASFDALNSLENFAEYDNFIFSDNQGDIIYSNSFSFPINDFLLGDISGDGSIDILDLILVQYHIMQDLFLGYAQMEIADADLNGNIDILDILKILSSFYDS